MMLEEPNLLEYWTWSLLRLVPMGARANGAAVLGLEGSFALILHHYTLCDRQLITEPSVLKTELCRFPCPLLPGA